MNWSEWKESDEGKNACGWWTGDPATHIRKIKSAFEAGQRNSPDTEMTPLMRTALWMAETFPKSTAEKLGLDAAMQSDKG
ncbi:hypothetical protein [uncultured Paraglaciecola sp.]|uniref:hypothetical protein n=1 Tax=uncultured Paraglaciecola sp. TaxID=1765024 RepID=UPI002620028F|nr:hypothetical protein [uncultured Paraglaciecola sp.]